ncbi:MAG TPA: HD domain-containing protein [Nitrosarchaeum sp.]|nr:HD domain-containing protein [Nitrosarchaeum sp.]
MILNFFYIASNLKKIPRQGWIDKLSISHPESVADHTFSMAIMGMIFSDLEKYNTEKILKMILLHDLAESITGDITPDKITNQKKMFLENNTMEKIIDDMPQSLQIQYHELWKDYQNEKSEEAKFVHQLDKFEMALQAKIYSKDGYSDDKLRSFFDSAKNNITHPKLVELFKKIIEE